MAPPKKGENIPKGKREKLTLARMRITLQKMEMPKRTRHGKLKVLQRPREVSAFLNWVLLVTVSFEMLF